MAVIGAQAEGPRPITWVLADPVLENIVEGQAEDKNCFCDEPNNAGLPVIAHADSEHPDKLVHRMHRACAQQLRQNTCPTCRASFDPVFPETFKERTIRRLSTGWRAVRSDCVKMGVLALQVSSCAVPIALLIVLVISPIFARFAPIQTVPLEMFTQGFFSHALRSALKFSLGTALGWSTITILSNRVSSLLANQSVLVRQIARAVFGLLRLAFFAAGVFFMIAPCYKHITVLLAPQYSSWMAFAEIYARKGIEAALLPFSATDQRAILFALYSQWGTAWGCLPLSLCAVITGMSQVAFEIDTEHR